MLICAGVYRVLFFSVFKEDLSPGGFLLERDLRALAIEPD